MGLLSRASFENLVEHSRAKSINVFIEQPPSLIARGLLLSYFSAALGTFCLPYAWAQHKPTVKRPLFLDENCPPASHMTSEGGLEGTRPGQ